MVDEGMCMDGPFEEDVDPVLGYSVAELKNLSLDEYILLREQLLNGIHSIDSARKVTAFSNPGVYVSE